MIGCNLGYNKMIRLGFSLKNDDFLRLYILRSSVIVGIFSVSHIRPIRAREWRGRGDRLFLEIMTSFIVLLMAYSPVSVMTSVKLSPAITTLVNIFLHFEENCVAGYMLLA